MKCLFIVSDFQMGGITSSLRNLCNELIVRGEEVYILNLPKASTLPTGFHPKTRLLDLDRRSRLWDFGIDDVRKSSFIMKLPLMCLGIIKKILNKMGLWNYFVFRRMPIMEGYDLAIGFRQGPTNYYIASHKIAGAKKIGFWHGDPDYMGDLSNWDQCIYDMDIIACVSNAICDAMIRHYPRLRGKVRTVYNIFDSERIRRDSREYKVYYDDTVFNIVTVSRIEFGQKNLQTIPEICVKLKENGKPFHWTIVGDGEDKTELIRMIKDKGLDEDVSLVGSKTNPYPYIKDAELLVLTSISESYGMVVMEALILGVPVVAGDYPALKEILESNYGIRAKNSTEGIFQGIVKLLNNKERYQQLKENCLQFQYSADKTYRQFKELCEE